MPAPTDSVTSAWQEQAEGGAAPAATDSPNRLPPTVANRPQRVARSEPAIATINGKPIPRSRVIDLLMRSRGVAVLEQLIGFEAAETAAAKRGLTITRADIDREYDRALRRLADPLSSVTPEAFDEHAAERLLGTVLADRGMSREEFDIVMRRNAYLRKIVESDQSFTQEQLQAEFRRLYGNRVQVRHIQLATLADVGVVRERLAAGEDFGKLAERYSANLASAGNQGLLEPFSAQDDEVPALLRKVAFSLQPGEVSGATRIGEWYHLIKLEKALPAEDVDFAQVRAEVERALRERLTEPAMFDLFEKLFQNATIEINDPAIEKAFRKKHPPGGR